MSEAEVRCPVCDSVHWSGSPCQACNEAFEYTNKWAGGISVHHEGFRNVFENKKDELHHHYAALKDEENARLRIALTRQENSRGSG